MAAKQFASMAVKSLQDDGSFEGILASYNTVDLGGDKIMPGAFTKTLQERGATIPILWQHKSDQPIGKADLSDSPTGLMVKGQLMVSELPQAKIAYSLLKAKVIKGMSIGFETIKDSVENNVRQLKEVKLYEGSIVTFPMNEACMVTSIKSLPGGGMETKDDFNTELSEIQLQDAGYQMRYALFNALSSFVWASGLTKDDKVAAAKSTIEQFAETYLTYFPQYLDWLSSVYGDMEMMGKLQMEEKSMADLLSRGLKNVVAVRDLKAIAKEVKEGRVLSSATKKSLKAMHEHVKSLDEGFCALLDDGADDNPDPSSDDATSKSAAAHETKTEPVVDHSAEAEMITGLIALIPRA